MKILLQIALIFSLCMICDAISSVLPFILPGSVLSMVILFILLATKVLKTEQIKEKANFMQEIMAFFFIPPAVSLMDHFALLGEVIIPLLVINIISAILCFGATGWTVQAVIALQNKIRSKKIANKENENA